MVYMQIELAYGGLDKVKGDASEKVKDRFPKWFDEEKGEFKSNWDLGTIILDAADATFLSNLGVEFTVKQFKSNINLPSSMSSEATTHIHLPNLGLLTIDEVTYLEDCCTDELGRHLDDGWRILAVCPPSMQRRPDYILGRTKKKGFVS